jgi:hypothetical protein
MSVSRGRAEGLGDATGEMGFGSWVTKRRRSKPRRATFLKKKVGPLGPAIRSLISSHRERLWSKAMVVSVAEMLRLEPGRHGRER